MSHAVFGNILRVQGIAECKAHPLFMQLFFGDGDCSGTFQKLHQLLVGGGLSKELFANRHMIFLSDDM